MKLFLTDFPARPDIPPSITQIAEKSEKKTIHFKEFLKSFVVLFSKKGFIIHLLAFGLSTSAFGPLGNLLDAFTFKYFPVSMY